MKTKKRKKGKYQSTRQIHLLHTTPMELLDFVKTTYIIPKPEISYDNRNKKAYIKLEAEYSALSINVNPALNGVELICEYLGDDNFETLHSFEYKVNELAKNNVYKKLIIPKATEQPFYLEKSSPEKPQRPMRVSNLDVWFDWYHSMLDAGFNCGLREIAIETNHNYGYIRQLHSRYANARRLSVPKKKPNIISNKN